ncbi:hypothetical protein SAMN05216196_101994 [Lutimaribacter pacificus]|nr:hypothetical protein SAMN05216196_101994 [Lutimaribacter pacificus]
MGAIGQARKGRFLGDAYAFSLPVAHSHSALSELAAHAMTALAPGHVFIRGSSRNTHLPEGAEPADPTRLAASGRFALWSDAPEAAGWVAGVRQDLARCAVLLLSVSRREIVEVTDLALAQGLEPVLRDEGTGGRFSLLFVSKTGLADARLSDLPARVASAVEGKGDRPQDAPDIPVLVPCFNNQTYCRTMIAQLRCHGLTDITLLDNASTSSEMHGFLDEAGDLVTVRRLGENLGPKKCLFAPGVYENLPRYFCVTDPDIVFNPYLPSDFIARMIALTAEYRVGKVGFALDISHRQFFREITVNLLYREWNTAEWEERFWARPIGQTRTRDRIFDAPVDTTFAVYDKEVWSPSDFTAGIRVGGRFTATHAPWYDDTSVPTSERERYARESTASFYRM